MKLAVDVNEVVLSNVGATGEFKIRNSAKAFKILSDGLYSNKIRAIIRELSCNAVDSHVGAGKADVPFEVHLPTILEPWFSVKDFGMGLDGDQVVNIYTTYFESTKTDSNDFIGALGLGSKSPFSYTENFTVIAIKDGTRRIYSAFINEQGVPSIAEMSVEPTTEGNGVEVKFSVTDRNDYHSFRNEAHHVFTWFAVKPVITGVEHFTFGTIDYSEKNIVPGVHAMRGDGYRYPASMALMGNIAYPINHIPEVEKHIGRVAPLLDCGLVLECGIGELDFAASREQLSFVPLTLNTIKAKLELLNANLTKHLAAKADEIPSKWERAFFLYKERHNRLYSAAVEKYVKDSKFELYDVDTHGGVYVFCFKTEDLTKDGLSITAFRSNHGTSSRMTETLDYSTTVKTANGSSYAKMWEIPVDKSVVIVLNDLKTGCATRARYHFNKIRGNSQVYCISHNAIDPAARQVEYDRLLAELHNPPNVIKASELEKQERAKPVSTQGIMHIRLKTHCRAGYSDSYTWEPYTEEINEDTTYYYVCLSNFQATKVDGTTPVDIFRIKAMMDDCGVAEIKNIQIIGVRKSRIKEIQALDNWVWFEEILKTETAKISDTHITALVAAEMLDAYSDRLYTSKKVAKIAGPDSDYTKYVTEYGSVQRSSGNATSLSTLCGSYGKAVQVDAVKAKIKAAKKKIFTKYPMLKMIRGESSEVTDQDIAQYITLIDKQEKV